MEWITQNWLLIVFGIGFFMLMRRGGMCCGTHGGHRHGSTPDKTPGEPDGKAVRASAEPR